ncbi:MAG: RNA 2',3'-cyclic phosphodiesterase [Candidatus Rokubacteria bacterium]|nr:RNA 2',3'-cyclic phosphodiesterase [Candidatus Rokubacteria bacterium]
MERIRSFVAILLSEEVRAAVAREIDHLRPLGPRVSWVAPPNLHLTLKFLGELPPDAFERVKEGLVEAVAGATPFSLRFQGLGAFPGLARPRVLWVGVIEGGQTAQALQSRLEAALTRRGFAGEERAFSPHLTIGRVREPRALTQLQQALAGAERMEFGRLDVHALSLMRSDLSPGGSRYTELATFPFPAPPC